GPSTWSLVLLCTLFTSGTTGFSSFLPACMPTYIPGSFHGLEVLELSTVLSFIHFISAMLVDLLVKVKPNQ
ncbi:hypothetical protein ACQP3J_30205, partial [Escherichia coli]